MRPEGICKLKIPVTRSGIEPATFDKGIQLVVRTFYFREVNLSLQEYLRNRSLGTALYHLRQSNKYLTKF
jgi:hypothetical protein